MKGRNFLFFVPTLFLAIACENPQQPNGLARPNGPSEAISDGTRAGGNPDFFFLPPLVPNPSGNSNFQKGKFNNALQPSLTVEICELVPESGGALPTGATKCANEAVTPHTAPLKTFAAGTVRQVGLPRSQNGWWTTQNLPDEGFYYVLWDTRQSNLDVTKYYRIKVLVAGSNTPLGFADVDPMQNMREWHNVRTGDVIPLVDDAMLPIPFRVERGALCDGGNCNSATITNDSPTGSQSVVVDAGGGSIAGARFPNGWLPSGDDCPDTGSCPQSVVVTVTEVKLGETTGDAAPTVCHPGIPYQQFRGCFNYTTTPALQPINEAGDQFAQPVTVAVCFELEGTGDPREKFAELYASGPNEPTRALADVADGGLLGVATKDCSSEEVIAQSSNRLIQLASTGWRKMTGGVGRFFGVKTAYAVDLGLGGVTKRFSHIGPVLPAELEIEGPTDLGTQPAGTRYILNVMVMGSNHHAEHAPGGIGGVPVTFSVASTSQGTVEQHLTAVGTVTPTSVESITRNDSETRGEASAIWQLPETPGTYTLTVTAQATGSPATFTATVAPIINLGLLNSSWVNENTENAGVTSIHIEQVDGVDSVWAWGNCSPWDCPLGATKPNTADWNSDQKIVAFWDQGYATRTQTITSLSASRLQVVTFTDFSLADGRTDYTLTEFFVRPELSALSRGWINENVATPGITRVNVTVEGNAASVQAFGKCTPSDCDWGATSANTSGWASNHQIVAFWDQGYATRTQAITFLAVDYVKVVTFTDFTEADGRTDYTLTEYFKVDT